jgi:signal transduction histidine kinase
VKVYIQLWAGIILLLVGLVVYVFETSSGRSLLTSISGDLTLIVIPCAVVVLIIGMIIGQVSSYRRSKQLKQWRKEDVTAYLHDSVLQTFALIQNNYRDADLVRSLARRQERELRNWLYKDQDAPNQSVAGQLELLVEGIETQHNVEVEFIAVGDISPANFGEAKTDALVRATTQALLNAVQHGRPKYSIYFEVHGGIITVYVRDNGSGFDVDKIPNDRLGVRESIVGRIRSVGGKVDIQSDEEIGTEICIQL